MIRLVAVAFVLAVATSAQAYQPDGMTTQARQARQLPPCAWNVRPGPNGTNGTNGVSGYELVSDTGPSRAAILAPVRSTASSARLARG